jgi:hypothetical protein
MPDSGWFLATGENKHNFSAIPGVNVLVVQHRVTAITNPKVRITGSVFTRRLQFAGSAQLLTHDTDFSGASVFIPCFDWPISWEAFEFLVPQVQVGANGCTDLHWLLPPGISVEMKVFW